MRRRPLILSKRIPGIGWQAKRPWRTAKSCGPGAATLASIRPACAGLATVTIKAAHRGEHEGNRKTIARGKPGCLGCTCQTRVHLSLLSAHGDAGAVGARLSLRPCVQKIWQNVRTG